jgi:hypothetical protein
MGWSADGSGEGGGPVKIRDRKRWERELTAHMRVHATDLHDSVGKHSGPGMWMTAPRLILWTLLVVVMTSVGWSVGLYLF